MPKTTPRRRKHCFYHTRRVRKKLQRWSPYITLGCIILAGSIFLWLSNNNTTPTTSPSIQTSSSSSYSIVGNPSINANFINRVLKQYHSPAQGTGQALYNQGVAYHIDPAYALAFFFEESTFGTQGIAKVTHSLGNIRATSGYASYHGYRTYKSWNEGFQDWYRLMAHQYVDAWGLKTVAAIIPVYAPDTDSNNEAAYIHTVEVAVDSWRQGNIEV